MGNEIPTDYARYKDYPDEHGTLRDPEGSIPISGDGDQMWGRLFNL